MFRPRIIPVLLLKSGGLVKSVRFREFRYIGDPLNAVRIFAALRADEIVLLDVEATRQRRHIDAKLIESLAEEATMPIAAGGGIRSVEDARRVLRAGAEKIVVGRSAWEQPALVRDLADRFGSSAVAVCIDARDTRGGVRVHVDNGTRATMEAPVDFARRMAGLGAGEIIIQSIDRDGTMSGYDIGLVRAVAEAVSIPVIALGGAGSLCHLRQGRLEGCADALAAGSLFVFASARKGVLINYPERFDLDATVAR